MNGSGSVDWREVPVDPAADDLGYDPLELDITKSSGDSGHYVILPHDEEFLRKEAFIVADDGSVCDLADTI